MTSESGKDDFSNMTGDLSSWARQGVLLINTVLTVQQGMAGSHKNKGWEKFTDAAISAINKKQEPVVFMLWGRAAQDKAKLIDVHRHCVLKSGHPSPLSANRGFWFGHNHFNMANMFLNEKKISRIVWSLPKIVP